MLRTALLGGVNSFGVEETGFDLVATQTLVRASNRVGDLAGDQVRWTGSVFQILKFQTKSECTNTDTWFRNLTISGF